MTSILQPPEAGRQPSPPEITPATLFMQFKADVFGKEVQDATTYSYTWLADQVGHVCLGLLLNFLLTMIAKLLGFAGLVADLIGMVAAIAATSFWEFRAYRNSVSKATGLFPLGKKLLRANAIIASVYMALGSIAGLLAIRGALAMAAHETPWWGIVGLLVVIAVGVVLAPDWLRQKIIWQKAALPYLSRLAEAPKTFANNEDARLLQRLISKKDGPPDGPGSQVVITGRIGSGRTSFAAGIGTEFAFKRAKVRYVGFDALLEFAVGSSPEKYLNDPGPWNIDYWPWSESQVVIIDNIGPLVAVQPHYEQTSLQQFSDYLDNELKSVAEVFRKCHSVWVLGDLDKPDLKLSADEVLYGFSDKIKAYCGAVEDPLIIEMLGQVSRTEAGQVVQKARMRRKGDFDPSQGINT